MQFCEAESGWRISLVWSSFAIVFTAVNHLDAVETDLQCVSTTCSCYHKAFWASYNLVFPRIFSSLTYMDRGQWHREHPRRRPAAATPAICQNLPTPLGTEKVFRCLIIGFLSPFLPSGPYLNDVHKIFEFLDTLVRILHEFYLKIQAAPDTFSTFFGPPFLSQCGRSICEPPSDSVAAAMAAHLGLMPLAMDR